jgi:orotate phosphoribosyltransferase
VSPADRERLLELLVALSFERRAVTLRSGAASDFYLDCKQTALNAEGATLIGRALLEAVERLETEVGEAALGVGGMTLGADPLATATSLTAFANGRRLHAFIVRKEPKGHGTGAWIEGRRNLPDGAPVVLLEDVVTTGGATRQAWAAARTEDLRVLGAVTLVDRLAGGVEALRAEGLPTVAVFDRRAFPRGIDR